MTEQERVEAFLRDLADLTIRHDVVLGGCGCCGSPWVDPDVDLSFVGGHYQLDEDLGNLRWAV